MPLKRVKELTWKYKQPPEPFPGTPSSGLLLGPSGLGKTTTLVSLLDGPYKGIFDRIHVFSPSSLVDSAWQPVREMRVEELTWHTSFDEKALLEILEEQRDRTAKLKLAKTEKHLPLSLIVLDDLADSAALHRSHGLLATLFIRSRHIGVCTWVSSQKLTNLAPVARCNMRWIMCWALRGAKERDALFDELSAIFPSGRAAIKALYENATDELHSFLYVNFMKADRSEMFYRNFDDRLAFTDE